MRSYFKVLRCAVGRNNMNIIYACYRWAQIYKKHRFYLTYVVKYQMEVLIYNDS